MQEGHHRAVKVVQDGSFSLRRRQSNYGIKKKQGVLSSPVQILAKKNADLRISPSPGLENDAKELEAVVVQQRLQRADAVQSIMSVFTLEHGGMHGVTPDHSSNRQIYFIGIIDILQEWTWQKRTEHNFKVIAYDAVCMLLCFTKSLWLSFGIYHLPFAVYFVLVFS